MLESQAHKSLKVEELSAELLSTLDEKVFFPKLGEYFMREVEVDQILIRFVREDDSCQVIALNGDYIADGEILDKGQGSAGHVIRTKKPYFSNSVARDPLFADSVAIGVQAELVMPVTQDGIVLATMHFRNIESKNEFNRDTVNYISDLLKSLNAPLVNMKMYLSAKLLNESLLKQIEKKEQELMAQVQGKNGTFYSKIVDKNMVANSEEMKTLLRMAGKVSQSNAPIIITGEKGVGKAVLAQKIHCQGLRAKGPFLSIDCSSMSIENLEIELFGEEKPHTLDSDIKIGAIEKANGGTILIEAIDRISNEIQVKLQNFLLEKIAFRKNGAVPYRSDVRIITTSTKDLETIASEGGFRDDLLYSLGTVKLEVPSLKNRQEDIEELATHFLNLDKDISQQKTLSPGAIEILKTYNWPGNVRELHNVVERAYILADGMVVEKAHLSEHLHQERVEEVVEQNNFQVLNFKNMTLDELEKQHICMTLEHLGGNKTKTAKTLGITVKTLYNKLHSYGVIANKN